MRFSLYQEFYKFSHKKMTWFAPLVILFLMICLGVTFGSKGGRWLIMSSYGASEWISLILVIVGSTLFSMEFQNNAILTLLYKSPSKLYVYLSKFIIIFLYDILLHLIAILLTVLLKALSLNGYYDWLSIYQYHQNLVTNMFMTAGVDIITSLLIISLIFLISCMINNNSVVVTVNIVIIFMGTNISNALLNSYSNYSNIIKWNPLNMSNLVLQYANFPVYRKLTMLSNLQITLGTLGYTIIFFTLGYIIFRKKRF
ncbi:ABC transporter permease [Dellaglioa sp. BT-FLS60]